MHYDICERMQFRFIWLYIRKLFYDLGWTAPAVPADFSEDDIFYLGIDVLDKICHAVNYREDYEQTVHVYTSGTMYEYNKLCRKYENLSGIEKEDNPFVSRMETNVYTLLETIIECSSNRYESEYTYGCIIYDGTRYPVQSCIVVYTGCNFSNYAGLSAALLEASLLYEERTEELKKAVSRLETRHIGRKEAA